MKGTRIKDQGERINSLRLPPDLIIESKFPLPRIPLLSFKVKGIGVGGRE